jgi:uncharacterized membrane protein
VRALLIKYWDRLRSSFWFLPSLMAAGAVALAFAMVTVDEAVAEEWVLELGWVYTGGAEGASAVLGTIASSMITIAGLVFSMTLVALSLASSQFGSRLLRNFMRDTANQLVLGTFVATFLYCLLVLRTIRRADEVAFVPHVSVTLGVLFAIASLGVLIYFIHHVSVSIQADQIVARVGAELNAGIDRLFPDRTGQGTSRPAAESLDDGFDARSRPIAADGDGYVQIVDAQALLRMATRADALFRVDRRPGDYVVEGMTIVTVAPGDCVDGAMVERVNTAFVLGSQRTPSQDVEFSVDQLVEIAARALSPGVNDPFTAITCIDRLGSALCRLAQREIPSAHRFDDDGRLRVVAPPVTFSRIADAAFDQIRRHGRPSAAIAIRLLDTIGVVAGAARRPDDRAALRRHAELIVRGAREAVPEEEDRQAVERRYFAVSRTLNDAEPAA